MGIKMKLSFLKIIGVVAGLYGLIVCILKKNGRRMEEKGIFWGFLEGVGDSWGMCSFSNGVAHKMADSGV